MTLKADCNQAKSYWKDTYMKRQFEYTQKESYSADEVKDIISQHASFLGTEKISKELETVKGELAPFKEKARQTHLKTIAKGLTDDDKLGDAIALTKITDEMDDESIKSAISETINSRTWLQKKDDAQMIENQKIAPEEKVEKVKENIKMKNL